MKFQCLYLVTKISWAVLFAAQVDLAFGADKKPNIVFVMIGNVLLSFIYLIGVCVLAK